MNLDPVYQLQIGDMHAAFGFQAQPPISVPDYAYNYSGATVAQMDGISVVQEADCAILSPMFVPHHQKATSSYPARIDQDSYADASLPVFLWDTYQLGGGGAIIQDFPASQSGYGFQYSDVLCTDDSSGSSSNMVFQASSSVKSQGYYLFLTRNSFQGPGTANLPFMSFTVKVGAQVGSGSVPQRWYRFTINANDTIVVEVSKDAGVTYTAINSKLKAPAGAPQLGGNSYHSVGAGLLPVVILYVAGQLIVKIGGDSNPWKASYIVPTDQAATLSGLIVKAANFTQFSMSGHAMMFRASGTLVSSQIDLGVSPDYSTPVKYYIHDAFGAHAVPSGGTVSYRESYGTGTIKVTTKTGGTQSVLGVSMTKGGQGYNANTGNDSAQPPAVQFSYGSAKGAALVSGGQVVGVEMSDPGANYSSGAPAVSFIGGGGNGAAGTAIIGSSRLMQYQLDMASTSIASYPASGGQSYAYGTPVLTRVTPVVDGIYQAPTNIWRTIKAKSIREVIKFDLGDLSIQHSLDVTIDNFHGIGATALKTGITGSGNIAVSLMLGYSHYVPALYQRFMGFCPRYEFDRPQANTSNLILRCTDQMQQLQDTVIDAPPDMDGWNHWYAMRWLLNYAGIGDQQIGFMQWVPPDRYSFVTGDPYAIGLPFGTGLRPWTPRDRAMPVLELANTIRQALGFVLFQDSYGVFKYNKWVPPTAAAAKRIFTETPTGADGGSVTEFFSFRGVSDTSCVRNQIVVIGIDSLQSWQPLVVKTEDTASINSPPGAQPRNYVGYRKQFVWADARFANLSFASQAGSAVSQFMRLPEYSASISCWMQPDIYPMDVIFIGETKSGASVTPFFVTSTDTELDILTGKRIGRTSITGRYII